MAPSRDCQVVRRLPDIMSKAPRIALASAKLGDSDPAKSNQAQLLTGDKEQAGLHVKQGMTDLVAIRPVVTEAGDIENSWRENPRFAQCEVLALREAVDSNGRICGRTGQYGPIEGVSRKEGIGTGKIVIHSIARVVFVDGLLRVAKKLRSAVSKVSAVGRRVEVEERHHG